MDDLYREKLERMALSIAKFQNLAEEERIWLLPLLSRGIKSTLEILELIAERPMTFEEIAIELDLNPATVSQKLNSLAAGGYPLDLKDGRASAPTGRPRKLARREVIKKLIEILESELL